MSPAMIVRLVMNLSIACSMTTMCLAAEEVALPTYEVVISLSDQAKSKLAASKEMVHVSAMYYGEAEEGFIGDEMGEIQLGVEDVDLPGEGSVQLGKIKMSKENLAQVVGHKPSVLINVYSSRKVFEDNLLDCGIFQDFVETAAQKPIVIACKLIGE
ncbi:MAG: hypothetical protein JNM20_09485 [Rhizobiales bacterium]|nr:hypothetical protein [Hyphomicrobiales bacterium]